MSKQAFRRACVIAGIVGLGFGWFLVLGAVGGICAGSIAGGAAAARGAVGIVTMASATLLLRLTA